jgi:hypothetical protein
VTQKIIERRTSQTTDAKKSMTIKKEKNQKSYLIK